MTECTSLFQGIKFLVSALSYQNAANVTPSNTDNLPATASALHIGVAGDITVDMEGSGTGIVFKAAPTGILRGRFTKVYSTGTNATDIVALW